MQEVAEKTQAEVPEIAEAFHRNWKTERRARGIPFRPATAGMLRYQRVPMCGHKFIPGHEPRHRNCEACWFTFFQVHGELTQSCDQVFAELGEPALRQLRPGKFVKNFLKFMSTLAQWQEAAKAVKETNEVSTTTASGSSGDTDPAAGEANQQGSLFGEE